MSSYHLGEVESNKEDSHMPFPLMLVIVNAHMKWLYAQYTQDLSTHVFCTINDRTTFFIKNNLTFEEATLGNEDTLVLMDIMK